MRGEPASYVTRGARLSSKSRNLLFALLNFIGTSLEHCVLLSTEENARDGYITLTPIPQSVMLDIADLEPRTACLTPLLQNILPASNCRPKIILRFSLTQ